MDTRSFHHPPRQLIPCSPLGSGSFGHVSLAFNVRSGSLVAVKSSLSGASHELLSLQNELHILQSLHSPHIIQCLGAQRTAIAGGSQSIVRSLFLEYMDGGSLADALKLSKGGFRDERLIQRFTRSIVRGLAYLHANGIAHCDIKSQNILIGSGGVKIADFGAARRLGETSELDGKSRGTPLWMAPEVALGEEPLPSADIWSLGCTVVEMLQGRPPWEQISSLAAAVLRPECSNELPSLPESTSVHAKDFLLRCLQRDRNKRWTAEELLNHPFMASMVEGLHEEGRETVVETSWAKELSSPRSTLDFFHSDCESDWEEESTVAHLDTAPTRGSSTSATTVVLGDGCVSQSGSSNWIVVRQSGKSREGRPFMRGVVGKDGLQVRKCSEVNFASAEFLRRQAKITVG